MNCKRPRIAAAHHVHHPGFFAGGCDRRGDGIAGGVAIDCHRLGTLLGRIGHGSGVVAQSGLDSTDSLSEVSTAVTV